MKFVFEHDCPLQVDAVFNFYANPANMQAIYGGLRRFRLLRHSGTVFIGAQTWIEIGVFGCMPVVMGFRHTVYDPPRRFAEEIVHGPFNHFVHTHEFIARNGGTLVRDTLEIELPWQYGGAIGTRTVVAPMVRRMFADRVRMFSNLVANGMLHAAQVECNSTEG